MTAANILKHGLLSWYNSMRIVHNGFSLLGITCEHISVIRQMTYTIENNLQAISLS